MVLRLILLILVLSPLQLYSLRQWSSRVVTTKSGSTRGFIFSPKGYEGVEIFLSLPYASSPIGSLRFMPPVSGSPWTGTKMNSLPPPVCPQVLPDLGNETALLKGMPKGRLNVIKRLIPLLRNQSEDCLYLNIYVPLTVAAGKTSHLLPVLVFVHGEEFSYGAGHPYDPSMLASQGNILVITMNYRLGILGFLNANADGYFKSPANFALLDQIAALHWVQENIGAFGGDRSNVTLMGHGKGGIFVNFLMISSAVPTGLLFQRAILMSGSALSPLVSGVSNGKELAKRFAQTVKCPIEPPSAMLHCLRQIPLQLFVESNLWNSFGPSDDGVIIEGELRENVIRDRLSHYPLLFGVSKVEALPMLAENDALYGIEADKRREILKAFIEKYFNIHRNEILAAAIHEYTDWERAIQHPISVRDETLDALGDAQVVAPLIKTGDLHSQSNVRSFAFVFEYQSKVSDYQQRLGCVHGEDLMYVFGVPLFFSGPELLNFASAAASQDAQDNGDDSWGKLGFFTGNFSRNEVQLSQTVILYWANFIRTGNPNEGAEGDGGRQSSTAAEKSGRLWKTVEWPPYDPLYKKYLVVEGNAKPKVKNHYRAHKLSFWLHLVPDLLRNGYASSGGHHAVAGPHPKNPNVSNHSGHHESETGHNSTGPPPPDIQFVGPPTWEQTSGSKGTFNTGDNVSLPPGMGHGRSNQGQIQDQDGFQIYSTALSVTIAIGCSLLILNILIFAAFYYQRDKRRTSQEDDGRDEGNENPRNDSGPSFTLEQRQGIQGGTLRRKENGQVVQMSQLPHPMPNICGELPSFLNPNSGENGHGEVAVTYGGPGPAQSSILKRQPKQGGSHSYEMTMPDAILAAAMMNMSFPHSHECSPDFRPPLKNVRRSSLTLKDHGSSSGHYSGDEGGSQSGYSSERGRGGNMNGSKTVPRPPKRTTPNVKFNLEGQGLENIAEGGGGGSTSSGSQQGQSQTLKPSLKKYSSIPPAPQGVPSPPSPFDDLRV